MDSENSMCAWWLNNKTYTSIPTIPKLRKNML